jgi:hypothetical protein
MSKHTPGPWKAVLRSRDLYGQETWQVNDACGTVANEIDWAPDAPLIAAAPELLHACKDLRDFLRRNGYDTVLVDAAIAKAEGA